MDTYNPQIIGNILLAFVVGLILGAIVYQFIKDITS